MTAFAPAPSGGNRSLALAFRFALRELRGGLRGFYIFIACIALGVAAISGVASVSRALTEGISNEGQAILGGDMSFRLVHREADAAEYAYVQSLGEVTRTATLRAMARKTDGSDQALVELKSVDGAYPLYGSLTLQGGTDPVQAMGRQADGSFGAVADASLLARLGLNTGDKLSIGRAIVTLTGVIATEPDKLSGGLEFGPRLMLNEAALPATGLVQPGSLVTWSYMVKLPQNITDDGIIRLIEQSREKFPQAGWRIQSRASASPGLERNIERFTQFLTLVGLTALVVGGVGVANAVRAFLESKREVIASFKCLGASSDLVFRIYLIQMMIIAAIGIAIGLVAGAIIPFAAAGAISGLLPVKLAVSVYPAELGLGLLYGLLTALAFAIWPLGRAHDVPPTALFRDQVTGARVWPRKRYLAATLIAAISLAGIAIFLAEDKRIASIYVVASAASFLLLGGVARLLMLAARKAPQVRSTGLRLAIANIHRPGALTSSVVLSLGLGLTLLVSLALIDGNLRRELTATIAEKAPSFFFIDIQSTERDAFATLLKQEAGDAKIQSVPMLRGRLVSLKDVPVNQITPPASAAWVLRGDRGITYQDSLPANSTLMKGEWWPEGYSGEPQVSFDDELATELGLAVGDRITVNVLGREITAKIANTRKVEWESLAINFVMVFSSNTFAGAPHAFLMTVTWDPDVPAERELGLLKTVSSAFPTVTAIRVKDALAQVNDLVAQLAVAIRAASAITLISSILVLAGALAAGNRSRIYDAVILKTLGATRARLTGAYAMEYAMLGLGTAVFAVLAGSVAAWFVITQVMNGSFTLLPGTAITAALAALVLTVSFGLIGTWRVLGKKPAPVLRNL